MGNKDIEETPFFCSWSGGKDSCLALYRTLEKGKRVAGLLTMLNNEGSRSRSHGLPREILQQQSRSLQIPLTTCPTTWDDYEENFIALLRDFKGKGFKGGVFGDIDIEEHREWVVRVCSRADIKPLHPLWQESRTGLVNNFIDSGFRALIVSVREDVLDKKFLGQPLNRDFIGEAEKLGIDAAGENGEYHTVVIDGPIFSFPIPVTGGKKVYRDGYWFLDLL